MLKLLVLVLGLVALTFAVKIALTGTATRDDAAGVTQPKRQLDDVRARAGEIERELQRNARRGDVAQ